MKAIAIYRKASVWSCLLVPAICLCLSFSVPKDVQAQQYASKQRSRAAVGYYARSRNMLVQALEEFEQGRKFARPDLLIDAEEWRLSLITLTEQLNRVLDPQPKVTLDGVVFQSDPVRIRRERDRIPPVADGARDTNIYGEQQRLKEIQASRAQLYQPVEPAAVPIPEEVAVPAEDPLQIQAEPVLQVEPAPVEQAPVQPPVPEAITDVADDEYFGTESSAIEGEIEQEEEISSNDAEMTQAIEQAVKDRLESLKANNTEQEEVEEAILE